MPSWYILTTSHVSSSSSLGSVPDILLPMTGTTNRHPLFLFSTFYVPLKAASERQAIKQHLVNKHGRFLTARGQGCGWGPQRWDSAHREDKDGLWEGLEQWFHLLPSCGPVEHARDAFTRCMGNVGPGCGSRAGWWKNPPLVADLPLTVVDRGQHHPIFWQHSGPGLLWWAQKYLTNHSLTGSQQQQSTYFSLFASTRQHTSATPDSSMTLPSQPFLCAQGM